MIHDKYLPEIEKLISFLNEIKSYVTSKSDMVYTFFETPEDLILEIDEMIVKLMNRDKSVFEQLNLHFLPSSTFQEHSMQNSWLKRYLEIAFEFDKIYTRCV